MLWIEMIRHLGIGIERRLLRHDLSFDLFFHFTRVISWNVGQPSLAVFFKAGLLKIFLAAPPSSKPRYSTSTAVRASPPFT